MEASKRSAPRRTHGRHDADDAGGRVVFIKWRGLRAEGTDAAEIVTAPSDGESPLGLTA